MMFDDEMSFAEQQKRYADRLLASAVQYLIQGQENDAAVLLLFCSASISTRRSGAGEQVTIHLTGPRSAHEVLSNWDHPLRQQIYAAFTAIVPAPAELEYMTARMQLVEITDPDWRQELLEIAEGRGVHNQGVEIPNRKIVTWGNLRFRSETEARVARALDAVGVLFLPNCLSRLNLAPERRATREADFLVCHNGKWGILEVDGPFHPRADEDHVRDRMFRRHGIREIERYNWQRCFDDAPSVVQDFLTLLDRNG